jgi:hypothetical protein
MVKLTKNKAKAYLLVGLSEGMFGLYLANTTASNVTFNKIRPSLTVLSIVISAAALVAYKTRKPNFITDLLIPKWMLTPTKK